MDKLQALLTLHRDKLWMGKEDDLTIVTEYGKYYINSAIEGVSYSLSELLFNTPFLSWLERKEINRSDGNNIQLHELCLVHDSDYHKINLALLDTDSERITYITNNTL